MSFVKRTYNFHVLTEGNLGNSVMFAEFGCARVGYLAAETCVSTDVAVKAGAAAGTVAVENRQPERLGIW